MNTKTLLLILFISIFTGLLSSCKHEPAGLALPPGGGGGILTGGTQACSIDTVYFQNKILPLIISSCAKSNCHDAVTRQDGVQLTSYSTIIATGDVKAGDPNGSKLYRVLNETDPNKRMPRPPSSALTIAEKELIYKWIVQGAKNNACNDCDTTTITYSLAIAPLINTNCKGCHNPAFLSAGLDLTNYTTVRSIALNGKFAGVVNHQAGFSPMPKGAAKLNDCKITQIRKWIAAGSLNN